MPATAAADPTTATSDDVTARYMGRLEAHIADLTPAARVARLLELKTWWLAEFERWAGRVDGGMATATDLKCNAADFRMTIDAVSARHAKAVRDAVPAHAQDGFQPAHGGER